MELPFSTNDDDLPAPDSIAAPVADFLPKSHPSSRHSSRLSQWIVPDEDEKPLARKSSLRGSLSQDSEWKESADDTLSSDNVPLSVKVKKKRKKKKKKKDHDLHFGDEQGEKDEESESDIQPLCLNCDVVLDKYTCVSSRG